MLPKAQEQQGFEGALILSDPLADKGIIVTFWSTEEDLMASQPPEEIVPHVERLGELIADVTQGTYDVFFQMHKKLGTQEQGEQP